MKAAHIDELRKAESSRLVNPADGCMIRLNVKEAGMESVIIFVMRHRSDWKVVIGDQRIGAYKTAEAACWSAMSLALQLRQEGSIVELRMHDEKGIQRIWPPEQVSETKAKRPVIRGRSVAA